jgi:DNA-binding IclR family transcriptional regulator
MLGSYYHMHCSGAGKAILANYPQEWIESILDEHGLPSRTKNTVTDRQVLHTELEEVRERGVSFERGEYRRGLQTISAPIKDASDEILGALSVSGPAHRMREADVEAELEDELLSAVNIIEINYNAHSS